MLNDLSYPSEITDMSEAELETLAAKLWTERAEKATDRQREAMLSCIPMPPEDMALIIGHLDVLCYLGDMRRARLHAENPMYIQCDPIRLKRGVSCREFMDILDRGTVNGGLNAWTDGDTRRFVLWGPDGCQDGTLLHQADDLFRQAITHIALETGTPHAEIRNGCLHGNSGHPVDIWVEKEREARLSADWTSAVLVTHPLTRSTVWPVGNKGNCMGNIDEHGTPSGAVSLDDLDTVRLYKAKDLVWEGNIQELLGTCLLHTLRSPADVRLSQDAVNPVQAYAP